MIVGKTFYEAYISLAKKLYYEGIEVAPRNMKTIELLHETFCIEDPTANIAYIEGRNFSLMHAFAESLLLFNRTNRVNSYAFINKRMANYSDNGTTLHGAYGHRINHYLDSIIRKLSEDEYTRQAVINIYDKRSDLNIVTKDVPCTLSLIFTVREKKLNLHVIMRSNDIIWGTPYDVFVFTTLQQAIANTLGLELGKYYHTAISLHCYENMFDTLKLITSLFGGKSYSYKCRNDLYQQRRAAMKFVAMSNKRYKNVIEMYASLASINDNAALISVIAEIAYRSDDSESKIFLKEIVNKMKQNKQYEYVLQFSKRWIRKVNEDG